MRRHIRFFSINYLNSQLFDSNMNQIDINNANSHFNINLQTGTYYLVITGYTYDYTFSLGIFNPDEGVTFNDSNLELAIRNQIGIYDVPLYMEDLQGITDLEASNSGINDLTGLEYLSNLHYINLQNNNIIDITPLLALTQLQTVWLSGNPINVTDGTSNYDVLQYFNNQGIECDLTIDEYGNDPMDATTIDLNSSNVGSINYQDDQDWFVFTLIETTYIRIATSSEQITMIMLFDNNINPIAPGDNNNPISITLSAGTYYINVSGEMSDYQLSLQVENPSQEVNFNDANLETAIRNQLGIYDRPIYISDLESITDLDLDNCNISDLTGLEYFNNLRFLNLSNNQITDLSSLTYFTDLTGLNASNNTIADITPLANLTQLVFLDLSGNQITQVDLLANLTNLGLLSIGVNPISDITPLSNLTNLNVLYLFNMGISDITPIINLTNLTALKLNNNQITDLTPLMNLNNLMDLNLKNNSIDLTEGTTNYDILFSLYNRGIRCDITGYLFPDDHSDTPENATPISIDFTNSGWINNDYDQDYFVFTLTEDTHIRFYSQSPIEPQLFDSSMNQIETNSYSRFNILLASGTYYIKITSTEAWYYEFSLTVYNPDDEIQFNDANLEQFIRDMINIHDVPLYREDLLSISYLDISNHGINDLTGLEYLSNLNYIDLQNNNITDITPLLTVTQLQTVWLSGNPIDITEGTDNYDVLLYFNNQGIECDLRIDEYGNDPMDATSIDLNSSQEGFINYPDDQDWFVFTLRETTNVRIDISSGLSMRLDLFDKDINPLNQGDNYSPISIQLLRGTYYINVSGEISDYQLNFQLENSPQEIHFNDINLENAIRNQIGIYDRPLFPVDVENIRDLIATGQNITDLTGIEYLIHLRNLDLSCNQITDITPLETLVTLRNLNLNGNQITDISTISSLNRLNQLALNDNQISDITALTSLTYLNTLELINNQITNLSPLQDLFNLSEIELANNPIIALDGDDNYTILTDFLNRGLTCDIYGIIISDDHSDSFNDATPLDFNNPITGEINYNQDSDYFTFTLTEETYVSLNKIGAADLDMELYDENMSLINNWNYFHMKIDLNMGTYYLRIMGPWNPDALYTVELEEYIPNIEVVFADSNFEQAIREWIGKFDGPIVREDIDNIDFLDVNNREINSISGIEYFENLINLDIRDNNIQDITSLSKLYYLGQVNLSGNPIDVSIGTDNYKTLHDLENQNVSIDIVLPDDHGNNPESATILTINNPIAGTIDYHEDQDWFKFTLSEDTIITLYPVDNVRTYSTLYDEQLHQMFAYVNNNENGNYEIKKLPSGTYYICLSGGIGDYNLHFEEYIPAPNEILFDDVNLETAVRRTLFLPNGPIFISDIQNIDYLNLSGGGITDLSGLEYFTNLQTLDLSYNNISDITVLNQLIDLQTLYLNDNLITDISPLNNLTLAEVTLRENPLDFSVSHNLMTLTNLYNQDVICDSYGAIINDDHGDTLDFASVIDLNENYPSTIDYLFDVDYFKFTLTHDTYVELDIDGNVNLEFTLYDVNNEIIINGQGYGFEYQSLLQPGDYYFKVSEMGYMKGNYTLYFDEYMTNDVIQFTDANFEQAVREQIGKFDGDIYVSDVCNLNNLALVGREIENIEGIEKFINLSYINLQNNLITDLTPLQDLNYLNQLLIGQNPIDLPNNTVNYDIIHNLIMNGTTVDVQLPDDYGNTKDDATSIILGETKKGVSNFNDQDWFTFTLSEETQVTINCQYENGINVYLFDTNGQILGSLNQNDSPNENEKLVINLPSGTYYLAVMNGNGDYQMMIEESSYQQVIFNDPNLEQAVREALMCGDKPIYTIDVENITELFVDGRMVFDLTGIEYLTHLTNLYISNNQITDITPLLSLPQLSLVLLDNNPIGLTEGNGNYQVISYFINNQINCDLNGLLIPDDHSDVALDATIINLNETTLGTIDYEYDSDYFKLTLTENAQVEIQTTGINTNIYIYDSQYAYYDSNNLVAGVYYIRIVGSEFVEMGDYQLTVTEIVDDHGNFPDQATSISINDIINGELTNNDNDYFTFTLNQNMRIELSILSDSHIPFTIYDENLERIDPISYESNVYLYNNEPRYVVSLYSGTYYINLYGTEGTYQLQVREYIPEPDEIIFVDHNLENVVRSEIGNYHRPIYIEDVLPIESLNAESMNIKDLTGLEYFTNLRELHLSYNNISDLTPLASLAQLNNLNLGYNEITSLSPLSQLVNLQSLDLYNNHISDVTPLSNLTGLQYLSLNNNNISDITPLSNLTGLQSLDLNNNQITDITPLSDLINLSSLYVQNNQIVDLSGLANLSNLILLNLSNNEIVDTAPLANLTNLTQLYIKYNPIELTNENHQLLEQIFHEGVICDYYGVLFVDDYSDFIDEAHEIQINTSISGTIEFYFDVDYFTFTLTNDTYLQLNSYQDFGPDIRLYDENMNVLYNSYSNNSDFRGLLTMGTYYIEVYNRQYQNQNKQYQISLNEYLPTDVITFNDYNLEQLVREMINKSTGPIYVEDVASIDFLFASNQRISDLTGLQYFTSLTYIDLSDNQIVDLSPLSQLLQIHTLNLTNNDISDLSPLINLDYLYQVSFNGNPIDVTAGNENETILVNWYNLYVVCDIYQLVIVDDYSNFIEDASFINLDSSVSGQSDYKNDIDYFRFTLLEDTFVQLSLSGHDVEIILYDESMNEISHSNWAEFSYSDQLTMGTYYIKVIGNDYIPICDCNSYQLTLNSYTPALIEFMDPQLDQAVREQIGIFDGAIYNTDVLDIRSINLWGVTDLTGIEQLTNLESIEINVDQIIDLTPLQNLNNLQYITIYNDNDIAIDLSPLATLPNLVNVMVFGEIDLSNGSNNYFAIQTFMERGIECNLNSSLIPDDHGNDFNSATDINLDSLCTGVQKL